MPSHIRKALDHLCAVLVFVFSYDIFVDLRQQYSVWFSVVVAIIFFVCGEEMVGYVFERVICPHCHKWGCVISESLIDNAGICVRIQYREHKSCGHRNSRFLAENKTMWSGWTEVNPQ